MSGVKRKGRRISLRGVDKTLRAPGERKVNIKLFRDKMGLKEGPEVLRFRELLRRECRRIDRQETSLVCDH